MEILAGSLEWTTFDAEKLASFLDTDTGKRLLPKLVEVAPALLDGGDTNAIMIRAGEVRGFQVLVREIISLAHPLPPTPEYKPEYPSPEVDFHWNDGQKLEPEQKPESPDPLAI